MFVRRAVLMPLVLLALGATGCSGEDEPEGASPDAAPSESAAATTDEFCTAWAEALTSLATLGTAEPTEEQWTEVQGLVEDLAEVGAPDELSADAQAGFAVFTDSMLALDFEDVTRLEGAENLPGVTDEEEAQSRAFTTEAGQVCGRG